jgi:hypothetical protein
MKHTYTQDEQIDCIVEYDVIANEQPLRVEEGHGYHYFDDSDYEVNVTKVYIEIGGKQFDITDRLKPEEIKAIENSIEPNIDL